MPMKCTRAIGLTVCLLLLSMPIPADDHTELLNEEERAWLDALGEPIIVGAEMGYGP